MPIETPERRALRDSAQRFLAQRCDFARHHHRQQQPRLGLDRALWRQFADMGWLGVTVDEAAGGLGGSAHDALAIIQAMGGHFVAEPFAQTLAAAQLLQALGSTAQKTRWLSGVCNGSALVLPAHAEAGARHELACVQARAQTVAGGYRIDGHKCAVPFGDDADALLVSARTAGAVDSADGISLFIVERHATGLRFERHAGIAGEPLADVLLDGVIVTHAALLGLQGEALAALESAHRGLLAAACAEAVGTLDAVLQATRDYARTRRQFGAPLSSFQVIAHRLVDMFTQVEMARSMAGLAANVLGDCAPIQQQRLRLAACKAQVSAACHFVGEQAVQIHGGIGMTDELALSHQVRRLLALEREGGDCFHQLGVLARAVSDGESLYGESADAATATRAAELA